ncbi:hypothetical protein EIP91_006893 [Steccherinum ochraceum]|uniref:Major facilitator superfamily (MFS) profile domain-containing protein n=1 Tax=Steccherinum ochraceum TaxID=92696 RepID=A0A4R0R549_9APHY|nr:hypothetical protein EIP91_006893 [Steccherinum ochraceum]
MGGQHADTGVTTTHDYHQFIDPNKKWWKNRRLVTLNLWILLLLVTSTANGYDGSMMNGLQLLQQWESAFNYPSGSKLGLLGAIQNIGSLGSYPIAPYLCDGLGRKWTIFIGAFIVVAGSIVQAAAQNVNMFIGSVLVSWSASVSVSFLHSWCTHARQSQRAPVSSVYNALWPGGAFFASWVTFGSFHLQNSWAWRLPSALQGLASLFQVFLILLGPESPRWLMSKGRNEEALATLAYYHAEGDDQHPLVQFEYDEIKAALEAEQIQKQTGWLQLVRTPGNRRRLRILIAMAFFSQWSGNGLVSYYLNQVFDTIGITDPVEQLLINAFLNLWSLILAILGGMYCDRFGRRPIFLVSTAGMLVFFTLQTVCTSQYALHGNKAAGNAVVAMIFLYSAFYAIAWSPLITSYCLEILPFNLRAKGYTLFSFAVSASLVFNQYINPLAMKAIGWKYYIVYCAWIAFELVYVYFFLVETKNRTLEETSVLFDGDDNVAKLQQHALNRANDGDAPPSPSNEKSSVQEVEMLEKV